MARELRIEIDDDAYEQLQRLAADNQVAAERYAEQLLTADLARARFSEGAVRFIADHAEGFAARFGGRPDNGHNAAA
ncbi:hypothetical protein ACFV2X_48055 [Streptomyces sp. NPDC059679]|uniref:hypothetical protein n=1 Tax=Streptomyces sp. NPDC059679 TaxID=3346903 RepID=UPI0036893FB6